MSTISQMAAALASRLNNKQLRSFQHGHEFRGVSNLPIQSIATQLPAMIFGYEPERAINDRVMKETFGLMWKIAGQAEESASIMDDLIDTIAGIRDFIMQEGETAWLEHFDANITRFANICTGHMEFIYGPSPDEPPFFDFSTLLDRVIAATADMAAARSDDSPDIEPER